jgi:hypothetical protein
MARGGGTRGGTELRSKHGKAGNWAAVKRRHGLLRFDQSFSNWRAITNRWISLVPSPMVHNFTSR